MPCCRGGAGRGPASKGGGGADASDDARKRFGNAKSISSSQFNSEDDKPTDYEKEVGRTVHLLCAVLLMQEQRCPTWERLCRVPYRLHCREPCRIGQGPAGHGCAAGRVLCQQKGSARGHV